MNKKGFLITIYGINNIGKTVHSKKLINKLKLFGYDPVYVKYPVYDLDPTGPEINKIIRSKEKQSVSEEKLQTLFMQNRVDFEPTLNKYINEGKIIVAEDYRGTGIAWGTAKGLSQDWVENINKNLKKEDFAILMVGKRDLRARESVHLHENDDELFEKVALVFENLALKNGWTIIPVQEKIEDTAKMIWDSVVNFIEQQKN